MKLVVAEAPAFKAIIDSIVSLVEEGQFDVREDGLYLKAMDPSQISMVSFVMPKTAFLEYNLGDLTKLSLNIAQFSTVLSRAKKGEKLELSSEEGRLLINFVGEKHKRTFKLPLLSSAERLQREPKIEFKNHILLRADALRELIKDAKLLSSHLKLCLSPDHFSVEVRGDNGEVKAEFEKGSTEVSEISVSGLVKVTFPIQYLEDMLKAASANSIIKLNLETDRPLRLEYSVEGATVVYYLAPRIETE